MNGLPKSIDLPPVWLIGFAIVIWVLEGPGPGPAPGVGLILILAGLALIVAAAWEFRRHKTTIIPHQTATALIDTGVFAYSRNPIYLADLLILAGIALRADFWPGLVLVPVLYFVLTHRFIKGEEARLAREFGATFVEYCEKTRRWV